MALNASESSLLAVAIVLLYSKHNADDHPKPLSKRHNTTRSLNLLREKIQQI